MRCPGGADAIYSVLLTQVSAFESYSQKSKPRRGVCPFGHFYLFFFLKTGHFGRFGRPILSQDGRPEENFQLGSDLDQ